MMEMFVVQLFVVVVVVFNMKSKKTNERSNKVIDGSGRDSTIPPSMLIFCFAA